MMAVASKYDVVVIGGGPAGMIAAGRAAERGRHVLLLEKNSALGKKLLITGGGRCNLTNNKTNNRVLLEKYKTSAKFLYSAFSQFDVSSTLDFFHSRGLKTKEEAEGRVFPVTNKAQSVFDVLSKYLQVPGVQIMTKARVTALAYNKEKSIFAITLADKTVIHTEHCIVATGGLSHPETGSTGEGFNWLRKIGHRIHDNDMALVPLASSDTWVKKLSGLTLRDVKLTTFKNGVKQKAYKGKVLFTHFGITGPTVLNMSSDVGALLRRGEGDEYDGIGSNDVRIDIDLFPSLDGGTIKKKLHTLLTEQSNKKIKNSLAGLVASALVPLVLEKCAIDGETYSHSVSTEQRKSIIAFVKGVPLNVAGLLGKDKAVVSAGGVDLSEVNFKTMQSRIIPGLFLVGDVLNIDRPSGGYSLQLCWTTGFVAGNSC